MEFMRLLDEALGTYEQKRHSGFMIAAYPDEKSKKLIHEFQKSLPALETAKEVLEPDDFHVTIRYWPAHDEYEKRVIRFLERNEHLLEEPIEAKPTKTEIFGHEEENKCLVIVLDSPSLHQIFNKIDEGLTSMGLPPSDYSIYKPHITLAEGIKKTVPIDLDTLILSKWKLVNRDDNIAWEYSKDTSKDE